jgi:hypothetical protein
MFLNLFSSSVERNTILSYGFLTDKITGNKNRFVLFIVALSNFIYSNVTIKFSVGMNANTDFFYQKIEGPY